jgi:hypothetical protein
MDKITLIITPDQYSVVHAAMNDVRIRHLFENELPTLVDLYKGTLEKVNGILLESEDKQS